MALHGSLSGSTIREQFIHFFTQQHAHLYKPSANLIPSNPTVLLTPAGMLPFVPVFLGIEPPPNPPRVVSHQKCARVSGKASDLNHVGRTPRHHTFFEMLGNFSFGDYFKKEVIGYAWTFITEVLAIPVDRLWVTVYHDDTETMTLWQQVAGVPVNRIIKRGKKDNFWGPPGPTGPCGPCSEIFYDRGGLPERSPEQDADLLDTDRFVEIWNLVFMELFQDDQGKTSPLDNKNVDTGMGLERIAMVVQGKDNTFETDLFYPIIDQLARTAKVTYKQNPQTDIALKILADHLRCAVFAIADGIVPSNDGRGYIIRMIIRRAVRYGKKYLKFNEPFLYQFVSTVRDMYQDPYGELKEKYAAIVETLKLEEQRFFETLERGSKLLDELIANAAEKKWITGEDAFKLYDTFGFPLELTEDIAAEEGFQVDTAGFEKAMAAQREKSRSARGKGKAIVQDQLYSKLFEQFGATQFTGYDGLYGKGTILALIVDDETVQSVSGVNQPFQAILDATPFYGESGGQVGDIGSFSVGSGHLGQTVVVNNTTKVGDLIIHHCLYDQGDGLTVGDAVEAQVEPIARHQAAIHHTSTHLLQAALKKHLSESISQAGSHVSADGARFDFTFNRGLTRDEVNRVEHQINRWIQQGYPRTVELLDFEAAKTSGALLMAGENYGEKVRVVTYGDATKELCGGTHVDSLGEIALVKLTSESAVASGIRRIELVSGDLAYRHFKQLEAQCRSVAEQLGVSVPETVTRVEKLQADIKTQEKTIKKLEERFVLLDVNQLKAALEANTAASKQPVLIQQVTGYDANGLKLLAQKLAEAVASHVVVLASDFGGKALFVASVSPDYIQQGIKAGDLVKAMAAICGGGGGGKPTMAQAGGKEPSKLPEALKLINEQIVHQLAR